MGKCCSKHLAFLSIPSLLRMPVHSLHFIKPKITTHTELTKGAIYEYYASEGDYSCAAASSVDQCIFHCDSGGAGVTFDCGSARKCTFECEEKKCASEATINAQNAKNIIVRSSGDECLKKATVNAPNSNIGTAKFSMESSAKKSFKDMTVNAGTNTQRISIDCTSEEGKDECKGTHNCMHCIHRLVF